MKYITIKYILKLHGKMIISTGGSHGIRDIGLLKSALENSKSTFGGKDLYPKVENKCASVCYSIINNHAFLDGNKRIGVYVMILLLEYNGVKLKFTQDELIKFGLDIAKGDLSQKNILEWIGNHKYHMNRKGVKAQML